MAEIDTRATPGSKGPRCLVFDSDAVVRRIWQYPENWRELSDAALASLIDRVETAPPATESIPPARVNIPRPCATGQECVQRTRALLAEVAVLRSANHALRSDREMRLAECHRQRAAMRTAIEDYALALRTSGVPPERALVLLKSAMREGMDDTVDPDEQERDEIVRDGVAWAIEAYYAA